MKKKREVGRDELPVQPKWELSGTCFYCLAPLEAQMPGGGFPRHADDKTPYWGCAAFLKRLGEK